MYLVGGVPLNRCAMPTMSSSGYSSLPRLRLFLQLGGFGQICFVLGFRERLFLASSRTVEGGREGGAEVCMPERPHREEED